MSGERVCQGERSPDLAETPKDKKMRIQAVFCAYDRAPAAVEADTAAVRTLLGGQTRLGVGMRLLYPEMRAAEDIVARSRAAIAAGATEIDYYNYGLVPAARLDWVRAATKAVTRDD